VLLTLLLAAAAPLTSAAPATLAAADLSGGTATFGRQKVRGL
jgi:hypothetical protein